MDQIKIEELDHIYLVDIPCLKCGKLKCRGTWPGWADKPNAKNPIRESYNIKEAIDQCYPIAEIFKDYCTNLPS